MNDSSKLLYTGKTHCSSGGRNGSVRSDDGRLDIVLSPPGAGGAGTNPEQLFAAGWSACFIGAMQLAARDMGLSFPAGSAVDAEVDLCLGEGGYFLRARLQVHLPGLPAGCAQALVDSAHRTCPYSKATRGNISTRIVLVQAP
jgi:Ohr subfamily peroxiredoxin